MKEIYYIVGRKPFFSSRKITFSFEYLYKLITGHSTSRAIQVVRITVRPVRVLMWVLDKIYSIH